MKKAHLDNLLTWPKNAHFDYSVTKLEKSKTTSYRGNKAKISV